jgi:long-chain acyl-CoA synthetase
MADTTLVATFARRVRRHPDAPLVVSPRNSATVGEVAALAAAAGDCWRGTALPPGTPVALSAATGPGFLAAFLALRRRGWVPVLFDVKAPDAERRRVASALGCPVIAVCERPWPAGPEDLDLLPVALHGPAAILDPRLGAVKLTSGSTGEPRGILVDEEALLADEEALACTMSLGPAERILAAVPLSHSYGLASIALPALVRGATMILPDEDGGPLGPLRAAQSLGATFFPTVPSYLDALLRRSTPPAWPESLRLTITAGAPLAPDTAARFRRTYGRPVHVFYGSSESGGIAYDREGGAGERGTVGEPAEGVRIELEADSGTGSGVVIVRSKAVARSYWPVPVPERLGEGRFRSGDVARFVGGELELGGRTDDVINIRGKKVNPREVEAVVATLPGVDEVVVIGARSPGRADQLVRAVIACPAGALSPQDVVAWCRPRLAEYKVPRSVVLLPILPRTERGKIDRVALRSLETAAVLPSGVA